MGAKRRIRTVGKLPTHADRAVEVAPEPLTPTLARETSPPQLVFNADGHVTRIAMCSEDLVINIPSIPIGRIDARAIIDQHVEEFMASTVDTENQRRADRVNTVRALLGLKTGTVERRRPLRELWNGFKAGLSWFWKHC